MLKKFQDFAIKGNAFDLAVGVIIGAAFGGIVASLVGDIFMPVVGAVTGGLDFSNYFVGLSSKVTADTLAEAKKQGAVLAWGNFLTIVDQFPDRRSRDVRSGQLIQRSVRKRKQARRRAAAARGIADRNSRSAGEASHDDARHVRRPGRRQGRRAADPARARGAGSVSSPAPPTRRPAARSASARAPSRCIAPASWTSSAPRMPPTSCGSCCGRHRH